MDDETLETQQPALTIRAASLDTAETLSRVRPVIEALRSLPRLSVDLRPPGVGAPNAPAHDDADLEVRGVIGEGGMGRVLLARQHSLSREVAVKTARDDGNASARDAILWEGAISGQLEHPSIVPVHALGLDTAGRPALVMKRIEGVSWDALISDPSHPGWEGWEGSPKDRLAGHLQILVSVCNAIHFAHSKQVVHRDVKPENVLIGGYGDVYLADWGVATRIAPGPSQLCGTPAYMAPEMASGNPVDARTDVYLLGATLHVVLTGELRHRGPTARQAVESARVSEPYQYSSSVPPELAQLANRACSRDPAQRPQSAKEFRDELALYVRHRDARALSQTALTRLAELEILLATPAPSDAQRQQIDRLLAEARFGLEQSLQQWAENLPAREALKRLEAKLEQRRQHAQQLEKAAFDRDPSVESGARTVGLALLTLLDVVIVAIAHQLNRAPSPVELLYYPGVVFVATVVGGFALRRRMLRTSFNRQIYGAMLVGVGLMLVGRSIGLLTPIPMYQHFARDSFLLSAACGVLGFSHLRWGMTLAATFALTGSLCMLFPELALTIFSSSTVVVFAMSTVATWLTRHAKPL